MSCPASHPSGESRLHRNLTIQRIVVNQSLLDRVLGGRVLEALDPVDGPEVGGKGGMAHVLIGHVEVALVAPRFTPRVADNEALLEVVVAHGTDGMAAQLLVGRLGHHHLAGPGNFRRLEARKDSKAEDEGVAVLQACLELAQVLGNARVAHDPAFLRQLVGLVIRLLLEEVMLVIILPHTLRAHAYFGHRLDAVPDHRPSVLVHAALHKAFVVVDEQPAWGEVGEILVVLHRHLVEGEVEGCCQSVRCAAAEMPLIEDGEATVHWSQVNELFRSLDLLLDVAWRFDLIEGHSEVAVVRHVWSPAELHVRAHREGHNIWMPGRASDLQLGALEAAGVLEALDPVDGPEVGGKGGMAHVLIGHVEVALVAPRFTPRVADNEALLEVVVAHGTDGMAAQLLVGRLGHHHLAGPGNFRRLEARKDSKAEDEGVAVLQACLELAQVLGNARVAHDPAFLRQLVGLVIRLLLEEVMLVIILPHTLRAHAYFGHRLDAVPDHGPSVLVHAALHKAFVVVDEQPAWGEVGEILVVLHRHLVEGEVEGCCQSVRCAAAEMPLIEDGEATVHWSQVNELFRSLDLLLDVAWRFDLVEGHSEVAVVRHVWSPAELHVRSHGESGKARMPRRGCHLKLGSIRGDTGRTAVAHLGKQQQQKRWGEDVKLALG